MGRLNDLNIDLPDDYGLSDCSNNDTIIKGTHKYFETRTAVLNEVSILATMNWLRSAFSLPKLPMKTFNEIYETMPKNTSAGFPFSGKKKDIPLEVLYQEFQSFLSDKYTESAEFWKSFNKEEILPIIDGYLKDTRQINCAPLRHYFLGRHLYGNLSDYFAENWVRFPFGFGMHTFRELPYFLEDLYRSEKVHIGDQSKQDARFHPMVMYYLYRLLAEIQGSDWTRLHEIFVYNEIFSLVYVHGHFVRTPKGNKSGSPMTLPLNCFHSFFGIAHSCRLAGVRYEDWYHAAFVKKLIVCTGDDIAVDATLCSATDLRKGFHAIDAGLTVETRDGHDLVFCGAYIKEVENHLVRVPVEPEKLLASCAYKSSLQPAKVLSQLCAMRLHCFFDTKWFPIFDNLTFWHIERHRANRDPEWTATLGCVLTRRDLKRIHFGLESKGVLCNVLSPLFSRCLYEQTTTMLSYKEWTKRHSVKLQNVPGAQKRKRYDQYCISKANGERIRARHDPGRLRRAFGAGGTQRGADLAAEFESKIRRGTRFSPEMDRAAANYLAALINPFDEIAPYPDPLAPNGMLDRIEFSKVVKADVYGNFCIIIRDGLTRHHAMTLDSNSLVPVKGDGYGFKGIAPHWTPDLNPLIDDPPYYTLLALESGGYFTGAKNEFLNETGKEIITAGGEWANFSISPWQTNGVSNLVTIPGSLKARSLATKYRTTAQGISYEYVAAKVSATGRVAVAPIPASQLMGTFPLNFDTVRALMGAADYGSLDEWEAHAPVLDGTHEYRDVKASHFFSDDVVDIPKTGNSVTDYSTCDVDAQAYSAAFSSSLYVARTDGENAMFTTVITPSGPAIEWSPNKRPFVGPTSVPSYGGYHVGLNTWQDYTLGNDFQPIVIFGTGYQGGEDVALINFATNVEWLSDSSQFGNPNGGGGSIGRSFVASSGVTLPQKVISNMHKVAQALPIVKKRTSEGNLIDKGLEMAAAAAPGAIGAIKAWSEGGSLADGILGAFARGGSVGESFADASIPTLIERLLPYLADAF
jgi:hypothetical protein